VRLDRAIGTFVMDVIGSLSRRYHRKSNSNESVARKRRSCCGWFQLIYRSIMLLVAVLVVLCITLAVCMINLEAATLNFDGVKTFADSVTPYVEHWVAIDCKNSWITFWLCWDSPFKVLVPLTWCLQKLIVILLGGLGSGRFVLLYCAIAAGIILYYYYIRFESHLIGRFDGVLSKTDYSDPEKAELREIVPMGVFALWFIAWCIPAFLHVYWNYSMPIMVTKPVVVFPHSVTVQYANEANDIPHKELLKASPDDFYDVSSQNETIQMNLTMPLESPLLITVDNSTVSSSSEITTDCFVRLAMDVVWFKFVEHNPLDVALSASRGGYCAYLYLTGDQSKTSLQSWKTLDDGLSWVQSGIRVINLLPKIPRYLKQLPSLWNRVSTTLSAFVSEWKSAAQPYAQQLFVSDCPYWIKVLASWLVQ